MIHSGDDHDDECENENPQPIQTPRTPRLAEYGPVQ